MKERHISPSHALRVGIDRLLGTQLDLESGVSIDETEKTKRIRIQTTLQQCINELNDELEEVKKKNGMV